MPRKKTTKLRYESEDRVLRWNYCQQIAKLLYASELSDKEILEGLKELNDNVKNLISR